MQYRCLNEKLNFSCLRFSISLILQAEVVRRIQSKPLYIFTCVAFLSFPAMTPSTSARRLKEEHQLFSFHQSKWIRGGLKKI